MQIQTKQEICFYQGKWSDLVNFINTRNIKKEQIQTINTFMANIEGIPQVMSVMFYWENAN